MLKLVVGTHNPKKLKEIRELLEGLAVELCSLEDFPDAPRVVEDGETFIENAIKKATTLADALGEWVVADDSGLEVDALGGRPGVHSARYAGDDQNDSRNIKKLLEELRGVEERRARFRCAIALARPRELLFAVERSCEGTISTEPRGDYGFGYDPVFIPEGFDKTFAELGGEIKNKLSHRGKALRAFRTELETILGAGGCRS